MNVQTLNISRFAGLALTGMVLACGVSGAFAAGSTDQGADMKTISNFRLNDKILAEYTQATKNLVAVQKQHPELAKKIDEETNSAADQSLADVAATIKKYPLYSNAVTRSGMSLTDYVTFGFALLQAGMYATMSGKNGGSANNAGLSAVQRENVQYYKANKAKLDALGKLMNQLSTSGSDQ